jgi:hypothetical protein
VNYQLAQRAKASKLYPMHLLCHDALDDFNGWLLASQTYAGLRYASGMIQ